MARIKDRRMKIAGFISISILLALGCAGRADKVRVESELPKEKADVQNQYKLIYGDYPTPDYYSILKYGQPTDSNLVDLYNADNLEEFYLILDTLYTNHTIIKNTDPDGYTLGFYNRFDLEVQDDSTLVMIMILDRDKRLLDIAFNQILSKGMHAFFLKYDEMFDKYGSGVYHFLAKVGSEERILKFPVLR